MVFSRHCHCRMHAAFSPAVQRKCKALVERKLNEKSSCSCKAKGTVVETRIRSENCTRRNVLQNDSVFRSGNKSAFPIFVLYIFTKPEGAW